MDNIFELKAQSVFSADQVRKVLPTIYRVTEDSNKELKALMNQIKALGAGYNPRISELEDQVNAVVEKWNHKVSRLGAKPKGVWMADFDNGQGFYCWKFPETDILHFHGYNEGFTGRKRLEGAPHENSPGSN